MEDKHKKNRPSGGLWLTALFLCFAISLDAATLLSPPRDFSDSENRTLAQAPIFPPDSLRNGAFTDGAERFFSDQFAFRDIWSSLAFHGRTLLGQHEINGVWIGADNYLFLIPSQPNETELTRNLEAVNLFAQTHSELRHSMAVIPNSAYIMSNRLPLYASAPDQRAQLGQIAAHLENVAFIDTTDTLLAHQNEALYYRTDHHWTSLGAYYAFAPIAAALELDVSTAQYDIYTVSENFEGTLSSKSGSHTAKDTIEIYVPRTDTDYNVTYSDGSGTEASLYQKQFLDTKDQYAVFLGGNHPLIDIRTTADTERRLLLVKDSYANCLVPFLTPYFEEIVIIDPRFSYDTAESIVNQYGVTDVLYLYNADTFQTDTSLADFLTA